MSKETPVGLDFEGEQFEGILVSRRDGQARPCVILFPTVMGVSPLERGFARQLVELGYSAFVADLFGTRFRGASRDAMIAEMGRLRTDRAALLRRLEAILAQVRGLGPASDGKIVVAGYCFGGLCALDLARSGADIAGAASFHGVLDPPGLDPQPIGAKVVVYHGWDDPLATPDAVAALATELTAAGCDWQIHAYGHVVHGFTNPQSGKGGIPGISYNALAAERSWTAFIDFLEELFGGDA